MKNRILYRLNTLANNSLGSEIRVKEPCPSHRFPEKNKNGKEIKRPKIELFACRLAFADGESSEKQKNTAILFGVEDELRKQNLCIQTIRSNVSSINFEDGSITISCPKLPKDTDAPKTQTKRKRSMVIILSSQPPLKFSIKMILLLLMTYPFFCWDLVFANSFQQDTSFIFLWFPQTPLLVITHFFI